MDDYTANVQRKGLLWKGSLFALSEEGSAEPIFRDSTLGMEQSNNNIDNVDNIENVFDPPLMESTCLDLSKEANEEYDTDMSLLIDQIVGSDASKTRTKNTLPVLVSTGNVENVDIIEDITNNKRKPQYVQTKKRKKMGW